MAQDPHLPDDGSSLSVLRGISKEGRGLKGELSRLKSCPEDCCHVVVGGQPGRFTYKYFESR